MAVRGWFYESMRHRLARQGVSTRKYLVRKPRDYLKGNRESYTVGGIPVKALMAKGYTKEELGLPYAPKRQSPYGDVTPEVVEQIRQENLVSQGVGPSVAPVPFVESIPAPPVPGGSSPDWEDRAQGARFPTASPDDDNGDQGLVGESSLRKEPLEMGRLEQVEDRVIAEETSGLPGASVGAGFVPPLSTPGVAPVPDSLSSDRMGMNFGVSKGSVYAARKGRAPWVR